MDFTLVPQFVMSSVDLDKACEASEPARGNTRNKRRAFARMSARKSVREMSSRRQPEELVSLPRLDMLHVGAPVAAPAAANADSWWDDSLTTTDPSSPRREEESHGSLSAVVAFGPADRPSTPECWEEAYLAEQAELNEYARLAEQDRDTFSAVDAFDEEEEAYLAEQAASDENAYFADVAESYYSGPRIAGVHRNSDLDHL
jgi:hypothetical protein